MVSIHKPHVTLEQEQYFEKTDKLASKLDAYLVIHSQNVLNRHTPELEKIGFNSRHKYENQSGTSKNYLENNILEKTNSSWTPHIYIGEEKYLEEHKYSIKNHLNDSTKKKGVLAFGKGTINISRTIEVIEESEFDRVLVLEVMPELQEEAVKEIKEKLILAEVSLLGIRINEN